MSKKIIISKEQFNALQVCKAGPKDNRYYLNGIHIKGHKNIIESTNGHRCLRLLNITGVPFNEDYIISVPLNKAPAKCEYVEIDNYLVTFKNKMHFTISQLIPRVIDSIYPDTDRVIPDPATVNSKQIEMREIAINPVYLTDVAKILTKDTRFPIIKVTFIEGAVMVDFGKANIEYKVMTARA